MNVLGHHRGDTSREWMMACLARHLAHWGGHKREMWLQKHWEPKNGAASCSELRIAAAEARTELEANRNKQDVINKQVGREALAALRKAA